jgi:hypothetical protein
MILHLGPNAPALRGSPILFALEIAILGLMIFWLARAWLADRFRRKAGDRRTMRAGDA